MEILGKLCVKCSANDWTKDKKCKPCKNARARAKYVENPTKFINFSKIYKQSHPEKTKEQSAKYYAKVRTTEAYRQTKRIYKRLPHVKIKKCITAKNLRLKVTDGYIRHLLSKILEIPSCSLVLSKEDYELYRKQLTLKRKYNELQKSI
jgi:hypothetical protein